MKDFRSLLGMSGSEADPQNWDEMTVDIDVLPCAGPTLSPVDQFTNSTQTSRISLMDWTECLIEMTLSSDDTASDEQILNSFARTSKDSASAEEVPTNSVKTLTSSTSNDLNNRQDTNLWQETYQQERVSLINSASDKDCQTPTCPNLLTCINPPHINDPDISISNDILSLRTHDHTSCVTHPSSTNIVPRTHLDLDLHDLHDLHGQQHPPADNTDFTSHSSYSRAFRDTQMTLGHSTVARRGSFTPEQSVSFPYISFNAKRPDNFLTSNARPALTSSSIAPFDSSLNTPVVDVYPAVTGASVAHLHDLSASGDAACSDQLQCLLSVADFLSTDDIAVCSQTPDGLIMTSQDDLINNFDQSMPEIDIATVEIVSCENGIPSAIQNSWFNQYNQTFSQHSLSGPVTVSEERDISCAWTDDSLQVITVLTSSTPEECPTYSSLQQASLDMSLSQILGIDNNPHTFLVDDQSSASWTVAPEGHTADQGTAELQAIDSLHTDLLSPRNFLSEPEPEESLNGHTGSLNPNSSNDLSLADRNVFHDYCTATDYTIMHQLVHDVPKIIVSSSTSPLDFQPQTQKSKKAFTNSKNRQSDESSNPHETSRQFRPVTSQILSQQQTNSSLIKTSKCAPHLLPSPSELTSDALLSPGDVFRSLLVHDTMASTGACRSQQVTPRTVSDASDTSRGGSDFSTTSSVASASCTDGEASQELLSGDKVKDTLRSRLTAKRRMISPSGNTGSIFGEETETSSQFSKHKILSSSNVRQSTCHVPSGEEKGTFSARLVSRGVDHKQDSESCTSTVSQEETTDDESIDITDDEEETAPIKPKQKKRCRAQEKDEEDEEDSEGTQLAKREKNRLAAEKCRRKKNDKISMLTQVHRLEQKQERMKTDVDKLESEREHLQEMLRLHAFVCQLKTKGQGKQHK